MPYISKKARNAMNRQYDPRRPAQPGELNYALSNIIDKYLSDCGGALYGNYNDVIGVLECIKLELYRRFVGPYENEKLESNGEVFFHDPNRVRIPHV